MTGNPTYEELEQRVKELEKQVHDRAISDKQLRLLSLAVEQSSEGVAVVDMDGNLEYLNHAFAEMHGYSAKELVGKNLSIFHTSQQMPDVEAANLAIKQAGFFKGEIWHVKRDGTIFPTLMHNSLIRDDTGKPIGMMGTPRDLTDRKRQEEVLRESEERYRIMLEQAADAVFMHDETGRILDINQKACQNLGYSREELLSKSIADIDPDAIQAGKHELWGKILEGEQFTFESRHMRKDGSVFPIEVTLGSVRLPLGLAVLGIVRNITERIRTEEALRESEERLKSIFRAAPIGIGLVSARVIKQANDRLCEMVGYSRDELLGQSARMLYPTDKEFEYVGKEKYAQITKFGTGTVETRWKRKDGRLIHVLLSSTPLNPENLSVGVTFTALDITERIQAEETLRESERRYSILADNVRDVIWTRDMNLRQTYISPSVKDQTGYTVEEAMARTLEESWTPDSLKLIRKVFTEELEIEKRANKDLSRSRTIELEIKRKDGSTIWTEAKMSFLRDPNGRPTGIIGVTRDISERKSSELALRDSEEKYRTVLEANPDPVVVYDMDGKVSYFNPAFTCVFGWALEERLGKKMDLFVPEKNWPETQMMINKVKAGASFSGIESRRYNKKGEIVPVSISGAIHRDQDGYPLGSVINLRDISEQKSIEGQLQQAQKMEAIGTLAGGVAHDFNNILGIILGNTELAIDDIPEWNPARLNLREVRSACLRARDVVRQLLSFARKTELEKKPINIIPIVKESLKLMRSSIPTSIEIRQNIPKNIDTILADPTQLDQVLINLCTNANHAMPEGGILEVSLKNEEIDKDTAAQCHNLRPGRYVKLTVSDSGHGIAGEVLDRIFDPYFTTKEVGKGTGMGLSVVHGIVKGHDGSILVQSQPGKGTIFSVFFPITETEAVLETETVVELPTGKEKILFIDDEQLIVDIARQMLERLGYQVDTRMNPVEALDLFRTNPDQFDLIVTDMTMPRMTGDKLAKEILKIRTDMPIILCTGFNEKISEERSKELGIKAFLLKPLTMQDLAATVRQVLDGKNK